MGRVQRIRIREDDSMEGGVRCPTCGTYTPFTDIIATGGCADGQWRGGDCETELALDLVIL